MLQQSSDTREAMNADVKQYMDKAAMILHDPKTRVTVLQTLKRPDPVKQIAAITVSIMQKLDEMLRQSGIELRDSLKAIGAFVIVADVATFGVEGGAFEKLDKDYVQLAFSIAIQDYVKAEAKAGRINPKALHVAMQADIRRMNPRQRKEIENSMRNLPQIARRYALEQRKKGVPNVV